MENTQEDGEKKGVGPELTTIFAVAASVTATFFTGIPMELIHETVFSFPFVHESGIGQHLVGMTSQIVVPAFDFLGWHLFNIPPLGAPIPGVPTIEF